MGSLQELIIQIPRADIATTEATYHLDSNFFQLFEGSILDKGQLTAHIQLDKAPQHIQMHFLIQGEVELNCDRTDELFSYPIHIERTVQFKLGEENQELDVDLYMVERGASHIEIAQHIYDFVNMAVPMKRLHPRFVEEDEE